MPFYGSAGPEAYLPANFRLTRYSSTAADLFWDRSSAKQRVIATDTYRYGVMLATVPGPSFFDDSRSEGASYTCELVATNNAGTGFVPALFTGEVEPESLGPTVPALAISESNLDEIIENSRMVSENFPF